LTGRFYVDILVKLMGIYGDYLGRQLAGNFEALTKERKAQLTRISQLRGRDVLVYAADLNKDTPLTAINYVDILPVSDLISSLGGTKLDLILETPGGSGEVAEDLVRRLRGKYDEIAVIVPGWAKSAGTIMAMAADEILMGPSSALGPIDAQLFWQGKRFSADALLEGMDKIKNEVASAGVLNKAYIPILQSISPGELQSAQNALDFAKTLVTDWLVQYKFKNWTVHGTNNPGQPVTVDEKKARAKEIADHLCDHRFWLTHGRSIKLADLNGMRLLVTDYSQDANLNDAITRYFTLLQMSFSTNLYKLYETASEQILKFLAPTVPPPQQLLAAPQAAGASPDIAELEIQCSNCKANYKVQANLGKPHALEPGRLPFPADNKIRCPKCGTEHDLSDARRQLEAQTKKRVV
jgi:hypothetical protein